MDTKERRRGQRPSPAKQKKPQAANRRERKLRDSDVVYIPPKPFRRGRFLLRLATVAAVVLALLLGMAIFFKVDNVQVVGCSKYIPWDVSEASGIELGSNLLTISRAQIGGNVISRLPYVDTVRVGIKLPDTVMIEITELDVVYAVEDADGIWWLMNDQGKIVDQTNAVTAKDYTQVIGFKIEPAQIGAQAVAKEAELTTIQAETVEGESAAPAVTVAVSMGVTGAERLRTALVVLQELSKHSISGLIDSVDLTSLADVELWYGERFQINLGDTSQLDYKLRALEAIISQMESYESGHLDISFKNWANQVGYTPFS